MSLVVVEARAALAAAHRHGRLTTPQNRRARAAFAILVGDLHLIAVTDELVAQAAELAATEALRGYDAVHLAAALSVEAMILTSADTALCDAAARRGLHIANPLSP